MRGRPGRAQGALKPGSASYAEARNASGSYLRQAVCVFFSPRPSSPGQGSGGTAPERHLTPAAVFISLGPRILTKGVGDPRRSGTSPLRYVICVSWMDRQGDYFEYDIYIYTTPTLRAGQHHPRAGQRARLREPGVIPFIGRRCQWHTRRRARSEGRSPGGLFGRGAPGIFRGGPSPRGLRSHDRPR